MNATIAERELQWSQFLERWPLDALGGMTLQQYSEAGNQDCFVYWLEARTEDLGSMWGGSSFKFGVYSRRDQSDKGEDATRRYSPDYAWVAKYGDTAEEAYLKVRENILKVAQAARNGDLAAIERVDLGPVYKWKLAFLYQDRNAPSILPIYSIRHLKAAAGNESANQASLLHGNLLANKGDASFFSYADQLWALANERLARDSEVQEILARFASDPRLHKSLSSPEQRLLFVRLVMVVHEQGWDWWTVRQKQSGSIRCGRNKCLEGSTTSVIAMLDPQEKGMQVRLNKRVTPNDEWQPLSEALVDRIEQEDFAANLRESLQVNRPGRWPDDYLDATGQAADEVEEVSPMRDSQPALNQILFGPPGTGKTYATINAALEVLDAEFLAGNRDNRAALKGRFDELAAAGLVRFVTFHQSFSYEDFVEGLRAENTEDGSLRYVVADGVFKSLCEAAAARVTQQADAPIDLSGRRIWKMSLGNSLGSDAYIYDECIEKGYALLGYGGITDFAGCKTRDEVYQRFLAAGDDVARDSYAVTSVTTFVQKIRKGDLLVVTEGNTKFRAIGEITGDYISIDRDETGDDYGQCRPVKWLRVYSPSLPHDQLMNNQFSQMTLYELKPGALDMAKLAALLRVQTPDAQGVRQPRVLIIDEINRGNVSRIFGELITLIEPSKRAGAAESLEVMLPYSKQPFSVPDNVYLIGTMNTADRSLAGLDIALRRRFVFREMPSRPELLDAVTVEGIAIGELLRMMNARIEVLLDRDHCLGHAYFMPLAAQGGNTLEALAMIFRQQILPLLQEYFFEDWQRIQWVLNDHRKAPENCFVYQASRDAQSLFGEGVNVAVHNLPWVINEDAFDRAEAYLGIINHELVVSGAQPSREVSYPPYVIRQLPTGTIEVIRSGQAQSPVKPVLREIAGQLKVSHWHDNGVQLTTRQLGRKLIAAIEANA